MSRQMKGYLSGQERRFVPLFDGNRDDASPVVVWIKTPTRRQKREIESDRSVVRFAVDDSFAPLFDDKNRPIFEIDNEEATRRTHAAISSCVSRVENYTREDGSLISSGKDLAEYGETPILAEVYQEIMSEMSFGELEKKVSGEPQGL